MSRYRIAEEKIEAFIQAAMKYGSNTDVASVVALNREVGKARAELLEMFSDQYQSPEEKYDRMKEKAYEMIEAQMPYVVEKILLDASRCQKAAADLRNCLQPLVTAQERLVSLSESGDAGEWLKEDVKLLDKGITRIEEIASEMKGSKS